VRVSGSALLGALVGGSVGSSMTPCTSIAESGDAIDGIKLDHNISSSTVTSLVIATALLLPPDSFTMSTLENALSSSIKTSNRRNSAAKKKNISAKYNVTVVHSDRRTNGMYGPRIEYEMPAKMVPQTTMKSHQLLSC